MLLWCKCCNYFTIQKILGIYITPNWTCVFKRGRIKVFLTWMFMVLVQIIWGFAHFNWGLEVERGHCKPPTRSNFFYSSNKKVPGRRVNQPLHFYFDFNFSLKKFIPPTIIMSNTFEMETRTKWTFSYITQCHPTSLLECWFPIPAVPGSKPLGASQLFILPRSIKLVPGTPWDFVVKSKLSSCSGRVALRQLSHIHKKGP